jgi:hypothetical protein
MAARREEGADVPTNFRLQCQICAAMSDRVGVIPTERDKAMLREFTAQHRRCADGLVGYDPADAVASREDGWTPGQGGPFGSPKAAPVSVRRPHGHVHYTGPYGEEQEADTISCSHCRLHMEWRAGVEKAVGFCWRCYNGKPGSGVTCGSKACEECVPFEQRLCNMEAGRDPLRPRPAQTCVLPRGFAGAVLLEKQNGPVEATPGGS